MGVDEEKVVSELKGNTLRVYWVLLSAEEGVVGVREVQRKLGFSSPTLAAYHLNKLVELGLVKKVRGDYHLVREVRVGVLREFIRIGAYLLPRHVLYATMFTTLLAYYLYRLLQLGEINFHSLFALTFGLLATGILWYETFRLWRRRP